MPEPALQQPPSLPPGQARVLAILVESQASGQPCPTYGEIGARLGISAVAVWKHIEALERKGLLVRVPAAHRAIRVVNES